MSAKRSGQGGPGLRPHHRRRPRAASPPDAYRASDRGAVPPLRQQRQHRPCRARDRRHEPAMDRSRPRRRLALRHLAGAAGLPLRRDLGKLGHAARRGIARRARPAFARPLGLLPPDRRRRRDPRRQEAGRARGETRRLCRPLDHPDPRIHLFQPARRTGRALPDVGLPRRAARGQEGRQIRRHCQGPLHAGRNPADRRRGRGRGSPRRRRRAISRMCRSATPCSRSSAAR